PAPDGMVWIPGGEFYMGIDPDAITEETPTPGRFIDALHVHKVYVDGFWMDTTEVTNDEFARFVRETKYITVAERKPEARDFPGAPLEKIPKEPCSIVFKVPPPTTEIDFSEPGVEMLWHHLVSGACWKHPEGPGSDLTGRGKHPVVHICWDDAVEYCKWAKK